jgi:hypothetical protein
MRGAARSFLRAAGVACTLVSITATLVVSPAAIAAPRTPRFGPVIEDYAPYRGQTTCSPRPKPGVVSFSKRVLNAYPFTRSLGISRACHIGGQSEHKEGRAWDWGVRAWKTRERAAAEEVLRWLLKEDAYGNKHALVRRTGIMYIIWNRRIWFPGSGWRTYCPGGGCHPHTDHVHFSFGWPGARKHTTFWHPDRSMITGLDGDPDSDGLWLVGGNAGVFPRGGAGFHGSKGNEYLGSVAEGLAAKGSGDGYWIVLRNGRVFAFGDARHRGDARGAVAPVVSMASTPNGNGYWLLTKRGRVFALGTAPALGGARSQGARFKSIVATPGGNGYWLVTRYGRVLAFGGASDIGGVADDPAAGTIAGGAARNSGGLWLVDRRGHVFAQGDVQHHGDLTDRSPAGAIVGMAATRSGNGYWLATARGKVYAFGDAPAVGSVRGSGRSADVSTTSSVPPSPDLDDFVIDR